MSKNRAKGDPSGDAPVTPPPRLGVADILAPRAVAVIGASDNVAKFGGRIMRYLTKHRFPGLILPINPGRADIMGHRAYARITDAPGPVDVALLAVPSQRLREAVRECAAAEVGCAVIMTTGFAELGEAGRRVQDELVNIARAAGMRIVGPNCMGLISPHHALALTSSLVLEEGELMRGEIGLISQSGALMVSMYDRAHSAGIGFSACVSLGNQSDLEISRLPRAHDRGCQEPGDLPLRRGFQGATPVPRARLPLPGEGEAAAHGQGGAHRGGRARGTFPYGEPGGLVCRARGRVPGTWGAAA